MRGVASLALLLLAQGGAAWKHAQEAAHVEARHAAVTPAPVQARGLLPVVTLVSDCILPSSILTLPASLRPSIVATVGLPPIDALSYDAECSLTLSAGTSLAACGYIALSTSDVYSEPPTYATSCPDCPSCSWPTVTDCTATTTARVTTTQPPVTKTVTSTVTNCTETCTVTATPPAVTLPPVTLPPVTLPPVTLPPITLPPVTLPPVTVTATVTPPAVTLPPVTLPPVTLPPVTVTATTTPPTVTVTPSQITVTVTPPAVTVPVTVTVTPSQVTVTTTASCTPTTTPTTSPTSSPTTTLPITSAPTCASCAYDPPATVRVSWVKSIPSTTYYTFTEVLVPRGNGAFSTSTTLTPSDLPSDFGQTATTTNRYAFKLGSSSVTLQYPSTLDDYDSLLTYSGNVPVGTLVDAPCTSVGRTVATLPSHPQIGTVASASIPAPDPSDVLGLFYGPRIQVRYLSASQLQSAFPSYIPIDDCKLSLTNGDMIIDPSTPSIPIKTLVQSICFSCVTDTATVTGATETVVPPPVTLTAPTVTDPGPTVTGPGVTVTGPGGVVIVPGSEVTGPGGTVPGPQVTGPGGFVPGLEVTGPGGTVPGVEVTGPGGTVPGLEVTGPGGTVPGLEVTGPGGTVPGPEVTGPPVLLQGGTSIIPGSTVNGGQPGSQGGVTAEGGAGPAGTGVVIVSDTVSTTFQVPSAGGLPGGTTLTQANPGGPNDPDSTASNPAASQYTGAASVERRGEKSLWSAAGAGAIVWALFFG